MSSPAQRYAAARRRRITFRLDRFAAGYPFPLDAFQLDACAALDGGESVLVAAPTGAGKTVVGEFAAALALDSGEKCFYTTPIKALSNQKYADLAVRHGPAAVGLLTGDNTVNGDAPIVVMTTEVLRNMLYAGSPALHRLGYVVLDEVHYLADRFRGAVWEEVIINLAGSVRLVALSATVSNAEEFADWLVTVRGQTRVVVEERRPVPLWQHVLVDRTLYDLFAADPVPGQPAPVHPALVRLAQEESRLHRLQDRRELRGSGRPGRVRVPTRPELVVRLDREALLPAILFVFSRAGCDAAVAQCVRAGLWLTTPDERVEIRRLVDAGCADLPVGDLPVLGFGEWRDGLERGLAAHHAGLLPIFKEVVEELFVRGLVKAVFATETLALGINMPARSVVLERLVKWNGETHADITPGEYTQLTGRAGRRGIDVEGHAVVVWQPGLDPRHVAGLASTRTYPLRSSFRPSYNMAVNLVGSHGRDRARVLLESSFAQFQADRAVVGLARQISGNETALAGYADASRCELGDLAEYAGLRRALADREAELARRRGALRRAAVVEALVRLRIGDVIWMPSGRRAGLAVVVEPARDDREAPRPAVVTADRQLRRISAVDVSQPVEPLGRVRVPRGFNPRSAQNRRDLAATLRASGIGADHSRPRTPSGDDAELTGLRAALRHHPCHRCPERDDHLRWAERSGRLARETDGLRRRVEGRTNTVARTFDRVCAVLDELDYLADGRAVTPEGRLLARLYTESDLLVAECLRRGVWDGLTPAELAACASTASYESRRPDPPAPRIPGGRVATTLREMVRVWTRLRDTEADHRLDVLRAPDPGFAWAAHRWASGADLDEVLGETEVAPGDFVRTVRQLLDLLDQVADAAAGANPSTAAVARAASAALRRGVVASSTFSD